MEGLGVSCLRESFIVSISGSASLPSLSLSTLPLFLSQPHQRRPRSSLVHGLLLPTAIRRAESVLLEGEFLALELRGALGRAGRGRGAHEVAPKRFDAADHIPDQYVV